MTTTLAPQAGTERWCEDCLNDIPDTEDKCPSCFPSVPETATKGDGSMGLVGMVAREAAYGAIRSAQKPPARPAQPRTPARTAAAVSGAGRHAGTVVLRDGSAMERAQPQREPINGSALLTHVRKWITRYLYLDSETKATALTLWVAGSHFRDSDGVLVHDTFPIAGFLSDEPGSGKTHALELLAILCPAAPSILTEPSEAAIARLVGKHHRTILLDEGDILFGTGRRKAAIRAILNSGYKKGGTWPRVAKGDVEDVPTYGAKAIAALSVAKTGTGSSLDALFSRMIEFEMSKPPAGVEIHKLRETFTVTDSSTGAQATVTGRDFGLHLHGLLESWAAQERGALEGVISEVPEGVGLREEEKWLPLMAVAQRAFDNWPAALKPHEERTRDDGDNWLQLAWEACVDLSLYGGTPDSTEAQADMLAGIMDGWE